MKLNTYLRIKRAAMEIGGPGNTPLLGHQSNSIVPFSGNNISTNVNRPTGGASDDIIDVPFRVVGDGKALGHSPSPGTPALSKSEFLRQNPNKVTRTWGEFLWNSPLASLTGTDSWIWAGYGNAHMKKRQEQADAEAYDNYLRGGR